jgi:hypothetical protein
MDFDCFDDLIVDIIFHDLLAINAYYELSLLVRWKRRFNKIGQQLLTVYEANRYIELDGRRIWYNRKGQTSRLNDLPAKIFKNGTKMWYINGQLHRGGDQPAVIEPNGHLEWWFNGLRHRAGGQPAIIHRDGTLEWWVSDQRQGKWSKGMVTVRCTT